MNPVGTTRRSFMRSGSAAVVGGLATRRAISQNKKADPRGQIVGEATAERVGAAMFAAGGNAVDAIVAGALAAAVAAPHQTGIAGYGLSAVIAFDEGRQIVAVDGNSAAPAQMTRDFFRPGPDGTVARRVNERGWLSAGVPGVLAGLQLILTRFGSRSLAEVIQPAIQLARDGFPWPASLVRVVAGNPFFEHDEGSRRLYRPNGDPPKASETFRNPDLAELLTTLARANSVTAFYRGDIAQRIADGFRKNGGLVTAEDLGVYEAKFVPPLTLSWADKVIHTAPLTAGGLSVLQMLQLMKVLDESSLPEGLPRTHARVEAMRLVWRDRLTLLGDPNHSKIPIDHLLSEDSARTSAELVLGAVRASKLLEHSIRLTGDRGTIHLSAADQSGNFAALTLTHGAGFGSCVTVDGLGLTLGHGMSRFDPNPEHPNSPGPGKRPLHNMVPTIVTQHGKPVLAVGGAGGRKIPNSILAVLTEFVANGRSIGDAIGAPRIHTEGSKAIEVEHSWPAVELDGLKSIGYSATRGSAASIGAVGYADGTLIRARR